MKYLRKSSKNRLIIPLLIIIVFEALVSCHAGRKYESIPIDTVKKGYFSGLPLFKSFQNCSYAGEFKLSRNIPFMDGNFQITPQNVSVIFKFADLKKSISLFNSQKKNNEVDTVQFNIKYSELSIHIVLTTFNIISDTEEIQICRMNLTDSNWSMVNKEIELIRIPRRGIVYVDYEDTFESIKLVDPKSSFEIRVPRKTNTLSL